MAISRRIKGKVMGSNGPPPKRKSSNEKDLSISLPAPLTNGLKCSRIEAVKQESLVDYLAATEIIGYAHRANSKKAYHSLFKLSDTDNDTDNDKDQEN
jgi:hypothetical protein